MQNQSLIGLIRHYIKDFNLKPSYQASNISEYEISYNLINSIGDMLFSTFELSHNFDTLVK